MDKDAVILALGALAHPLRLDVYRALVVAGASGRTPGVLIAQLGVPAATLSFHLKELTTAGLIRAERRGRQLLYRTDYARMNGLLGYLTENCCAGTACAPSTPRCALDDR